MLPRIRRTPAWPVLVAALALLWPAPGSSSPGLNATLGFGGYAVPGRWAPLWIDCDADPGPEARIEVRRLGSDGRILGLESFPLQEGGRIECPIWLEGGLEGLSVRLDSGAGILAEAKLDPRSRLFPGHLVLACGLPLASRLAIASALLPGEPIQTIAVDQSELPDNGLDYDGVSALAMVDTGTSLRPAQREALLAWVAGGGRLFLSSAGPASAGLPAPPAGAGGGLAADSSETPYGLGSLVHTTRELSELPLSRDPAFWRSTLGLSPYGSSPRLSASSLGSGEDAGAGAGGQAEPWPDEAARTARLALLVALCLWAGAALAAAFLAKGRVWPIAALAAVSLALILAGAPALGRVLRQGASARVLALLLPGSGAGSSLAPGATLLSVSILRPKPQPPFEWTRLRALRTLSLGYRSQEVLATAGSGTRGQPEWRHRLSRSSFSLKSSGEEALELQAVLGEGSVAGWSLPAALLDADYRGGGRPPELEVPGSLAFIAPGEAEQWLERAQGGAWTRLEKPPLWLGPELDWLRRLRDSAPELAFLTGRALPPSGILISGSPPRELLWALPLRDPLRSPLQTPGGKR